MGMTTIQFMMEMTRNDRNNKAVYQHKGVRLRNSGRQICYMNSAMLSSQLFTSHMASSHCITCSYFKQLIEKIEMYCIQTIENCFKLKQAIGEIYPRFKPNHQQDPHDLLIILIGLCETV